MKQQRRVDMKQKPKRKKSVIVRVIVLGVSIYMISTLMGLGNELADAKAELGKLENQRDLLKLTIQEYQAWVDTCKRGRQIIAALEKSIPRLTADDLGVLEKFIRLDE
jgi:hypothetical protein